MVARLVGLVDLISLFPDNRLQIALRLFVFSQYSNLAMDLSSEEPGLNSNKGKRFFSTPLHPDQL
jgi:hypothetical protein